MILGVKATLNAVKDAGDQIYELPRSAEALKALAEALKALAETLAEIEKDKTRPRYSEPIRTTITEDDPPDAKTSIEIENLIKSLPPHLQPRSSS